MRKEITLGDLERALIRLGFILSRSTASHKTYSNEFFGAMVVLPPHSKNESVSPAHLVAVRRTLSEKGVVDQDSFERLLEDVSVNGV